MCKAINHVTCRNLQIAGHVSRTVVAFHKIQEQLYVYMSVLWNIAISDINEVTLILNQILHNLRETVTHATCRTLAK
jgi:hypothetical protein